MKVIFMGTPDFAVPTLEKIIEAGHNVIAVVTQPDKPKNRGMQMQESPVKEVAKKHNIPVFQPEKVRRDKEFIDKLKELNADVSVIVAFGQILPKEVLEAPKYGSINVHGSLLPKYRGAAPIQWAVINGETTTGVTTMYMDEGLDTGDMIFKEETEIGKEETAGELYERLKVMGANLLVKTLDAIEKGNAPREKQIGESTYAHMLTKETGVIDWNKTSKEIDCLVRGVNPWPSAYTEIAGKKFKVHKVAISDEKGIPGNIIYADNKKGLVIGTGDGAIELLEIQPENKKRMSAKDYLRGNTLL